MATHVRVQRPKGPTSRKQLRFSYLMLGFGAGIVVLTLLQLTTFSRHAVPQHQSPVHQALRDQLNQSNKKGDNQSSVKQEQERVLQENPSSIRKNDRRRLNSTHGNRSNTENVSKVENPNNNNNNVPSNAGKPRLNFFNRSVNMRARQVNATGNRTNGRSMSYVDVARLVNATKAKGRTVTFGKPIRRTPVGTANASNILQRNGNMRPFRVQRSIPNPPPEFGNRSMPVDPLSPLFDITTLTPTNYTLRSEWHGVLLDAGRHYLKWIGSNECWISWLCCNTIVCTFD